MTQALLQKILLRAGKNYAVDPNIPSSLIWNSFATRAMHLIRGLIKTRHRVFVGRGTKIRNASNIQWGQHVSIGQFCDIDGYAKSPVVLGNCVKIGDFSKIITTSHFSKYGAGLYMGNHSAIGDYAHIGATGKVVIGNDVIMGSYVSFHAENHNFSDIHLPIREQGTSSKGIQIGNDVWVGAKVTFLDGAVVGDHSVVAAGAVVTGVFPAYSVIGGVPAKIIKTRTSENNQ